MRLSVTVTVLVSFSGQVYRYFFAFTLPVPATDTGFLTFLPPIMLPQQL
jgi:hypothetical protein